MLLSIGQEPWLQFENVRFYALKLAIVSPDALLALCKAWQWIPDKFSTSCLLWINRSSTFNKFEWVFEARLRSIGGTKLPSFSWVLLSLSSRSCAVFLSTLQIAGPEDPIFENRASWSSNDLWITSKITRAGDRMKITLSWFYPCPVR